MKFSHYRAYALINELEEIDKITDPVQQAAAWFEWRVGALKFLKMSQLAQAQGSQLLSLDRPPLQNQIGIHLITSQN